ncbi:MAG: hypothetical protein KGL39_12075 [Patescibacteria group bacterium]|nr:hypothetical protein [Patescibacteria group bacterium]
MIALLTATTDQSSHTFTVCPNYASGCQCPKDSEGNPPPHPVYTFGAAVPEGFSLPNAPAEWLANLDPAAQTTTAEALSAGATTFTVAGGTFAPGQVVALNGGGASEKVTLASASGTTLTSTTPLANTYPSQAAADGHRTQAQWAALSAHDQWRVQCLIEALRLVDAAVNKPTPTPVDSLTGMTL